MARQIIILDQRLPGDPGSAGEISFRAAFWLVTPTSRVSMYVNATTQSTVHDGSVTPAELTEIQEGRVVEVVDALRFANGTTIATIEAALVAEYAARQAALNAETQFRRYGSFYDGAAWTLVNKVN